MEEGREELVDFEMRLYTFLWKTLVPYNSSTNATFHRPRINWLEFTDKLFCELDRPFKSFELNEKQRLDFICLCITIL